jgi:hypothetical protein
MTEIRSSRASLALALQEYKGPRPGISLTVAAIALLAAVVVGVVHIVMLGQSGNAIDDGRRTIRALHSYNAALEVWRKMATTPVQFSEQERLRDSIASALRDELAVFREEITDTVDQKLVAQVLEDVSQPPSVDGWGPELGLRGRAAMVVLTARQDSALFLAAARYNRSQYVAALFIGLAVVAAGVLIVPMSWLYVRYKREQSNPVIITVGGESAGPNS